MQENINIPDSTITTNLSFRNLVLMNMQQLTNFPYIEKDFDALTDYELLCLVVKYLNDVIANQNEQNDSITRMYNSFLALQNYVNNTKDEVEDAFNNLDNYVRTYFENLDVQDEINNKLDVMASDGTLEEIINQDNMVVVGDSYTALPLSNWAESVAQELHLTLYKHATSSMGYVHAIQDKTFIDNLTWGMAESLRLKTKYLICYGGLNDLNETPSDVTTAVQAFCTQAKTLFPNAHIIIVGPQSDIPSANSKKLFDIINAIHEGAVNSGVGYADAHTWLYDTPYGYAYTYASDNTHPNETGYKIITSKMLSLIIGNVNNQASILVTPYNDSLAEVTTIRTTQHLNSTHVDMRITSISMANESFTKVGKVSTLNLGFANVRSPLMILAYNASYGFYTKLIGFATIGTNGDINAVNITGTDYTGAIEVVGDIELTYNNQK